ncbi:MAG: hypothetical protein H7X80_01000 [bacterium]|nr:hypothetical protein [Candidatus Kapabacteria bacterium]
MCIVSRLLTTIHYIEDPDSLRFALSMVEFDITRLQPHFPGYVVFVALARMFTSTAGSFAVAFSLVGGVATFLLITGMLRLLRWHMLSGRGIVLTLVMLTNGMLWIYGNRYMPDLLGTSMLVWAIGDLARGTQKENIRGAFVAGLLAGTRLSYLPFLIPAGIVAIQWRTGRLKSILAFTIGVALWASSLIASTGWTNLIEIGKNQTAGHFDEFGGTIRTEPDVLHRASSMAEGLWTDALGGYAVNRSLITIVAGIGVVVSIVLSMQGLIAWLRTRHARIVVAGIVAYFVWIFLFQNVIYHSRHLLPIVPFVLVLVAYGLHQLATMNRIATAGAAVLACSMSLVGVTLAFQHQKPSAIAQVRQHLGDSSAMITVVSTGLVNSYLASTGVRARFLNVESDNVRDSLRADSTSAAIVSVGDYRSLVKRPIEFVRHFFHNPHVNRIWPHIEVYEYARADSLR